MTPVTSVIPVFAVIALGWVANRFWRFGPEFRSQANALVYYLAVPVLILVSVEKAPFREAFSARSVVAVVVAVGISWLLALAAGKMLGLTGGRLGTFLQSSFHSNTGYVGLAMAFYALGTPGLRKAGTLAGFLILTNNSLSLLSLLWTAGGPAGQRKWHAAKALLVNPILWAAFAGLLLSASGVGIPEVVGKSLDIVASLSLPMALILIGASLSRESMAGVGIPSLVVSAFKLAILPAVGYALLTQLGLPPLDRAVGVVLLAAPTATLSYVMAGELGGDTELASGAVSVTTIISALTYPLWIALLT